MNPDYFKKIFAQYKNKNIVLYGTGIKTHDVVKNCNYNIIGLMDKDPENIGKYFYSKRVLSTDEVINNADIIIIMSSNIYFDVIFTRIEFLQSKYGIPIYFCDGTRAVSAKLNEKITMNPYWGTTANKLKKQIDKHKIISFDIFDTLITRKISQPQDLLSIMAYKHFDKDFMHYRINAEITLGANAKLTDIYHSMPEKYKKGLKLEEELELQLAVPRYEMIDLLNYAKSKRKEVYLISDIYHTKDFMEKLLEKCGIQNYDKLILSCEIGKRKSDSTLFEHYANNAPNMLHIGDNASSDIENAKKAGLGTYHILSPYDMLKSSSLQNIIPHICTNCSSVIVGNIISRIFNSPFALSKSKGTPIIDNLEDIGYIYYAPIILTYIFWILKQKADKVIFVSRDGWFLKKIYNKFKNNAIYLNISRALITQINMRNKNDVIKALNINFYGKMSDYFNIRYGITIENDSCINTNTDRDLLLKIVNEHMEEILLSAKKQRRLYLKYLKTAIQDGESIALVDPSFNGTNQKCLEKLIDNKINGYYCNANIGKNMYALFQDCDDKKAEKSNIRKNCLFFEDGILVAPTGTPLKINEDLTFQYSYAGKTQENFSDKEKIFNGVLDFIEDYLKIFDTKDIPDAKFIDFIAGEIFSAKTLLTKDIKDKFWIDTIFECVKNEKMFD